MNPHPRRWKYDTAECHGRKPRVNVQSCVRYRVCFGTRGVVLCKSCDVEIVQDARGVFNCWRCVQLLAVCTIAGGVFNCCRCV